jgi:hypothetical protein
MASEVSVIADAFGGEIARVITEQINKYFIPSITKFIDDKETPGAMAPLVTFLDSVPLAMTREEPSPEQTTPNPINTQLAAPPSGPAPESFAGQTAVQQEKVAIMPKGSRSLHESSASSPFEFKARSLKQSSPIMEAASQRVGTKIFEAMEMWSVYRISPRGDKSLIASNLTEAEAKLRCSRLNEGLTDIDIFRYAALKSETTKVGVKKPCSKKVTESKTTLDEWLNDDSTTDDLSEAQKDTLFDLANSGDFEEEDLQAFIDDPDLLDL